MKIDIEDKELMAKIDAIPDYQVRWELWKFLKENETHDPLPKKEVVSKVGKKQSYPPAAAGYKNGQFMLNQKSGVYVEFTNVAGKKNTVKYAGWRMIPGAIQLDADQAARMRNITSFTGHAVALKHGKEATSNLREWIRCDCNGNVIPGEQNYYWTFRNAGYNIKG